MTDSSKHSGEYNLQIKSALDIDIQETENTEQVIETRDNNKTGQTPYFSSILMLIIYYILFSKRPISRFNAKGDYENGIL